MIGEDKQSMMIKMMDMFFGSMTSEEKKEFMRHTMPKMMEKMMLGMTAEDKQEMMGSMRQDMMSTMFSGEGDMRPMMMQMMKSMMSSRGQGEEGKRQSRSASAQEDFKPLEFCPRCDLCEEDFKKKYKGKIAYP